jgi:hypothetical protein
MTVNEANWDRGIRLALGLGGIAIALMGISPWGWLGLVLAATAGLGWCPIYAALGLKTSKPKA